MVETADRFNMLLCSLPQGVTVCETNHSHHSRSSAIGTPCHRKGENNQRRADRRYSGIAMLG